MWKRTTQVRDDDLEVEQWVMCAENAMTLKFKQIDHVYELHICCPKRYIVPWPCEVIVIRPMVLGTMPLRWGHIFGLCNKHIPEIKRRMHHIIGALQHLDLVHDVTLQIVDLGCELLRLDVLAYCV